VLAIVPTFYPSTIVGVVKPLQQLHQQRRIHLEITLQYFVTARAIAAADVVVMCGEALPPTRRILGWIADLRRPLVYELDDNRLHVPESIPGLDYARDPVQRALIIDCVQAADVVRVYSPCLKDLLEPYSSNVVLVDGPVDWDLVEAAPPGRPAGPIKLVYATSRRLDRIGALLVDPIRAVLDRFSNVELTLWGSMLPDLAAHPRVRHRGFVRNYDRFFRQFSGEHFDIGLAPLPDDVFHRCKSNNKFREYAACAVAGIYSDMPVYNTCAVDGSTGLLVADRPSAWFDAMARLITDDATRRQIGDRAQAYAREHYNERVTGAAWMSIFSSVRARPQMADGAGPAESSQPAPTARRASEITPKLLGMFRNGPGATWRRIGDYTSSVAQIVSWRLRRSA
jgi:glycosyltransferase involved in cell wall biosynthesis